MAGPLLRASTAIACVAGLALLAWNGSRFIHAEARPRTKDLAFLPSPVMARALALGHTNTAAKLRWIDSFAYFELQLDRKDDTIAASGESAFERLYRALIALDPQFVPYYEHAVLNLGGILQRRQLTLEMLELGLLNRPHETQLWRLLAAEIAVNYKAEERNPMLLESVLHAWHDAETTEDGRQAVLDWTKALGRRVYKGLEQLAYWEEQLRVAVPGSPTRDFVVGTMREMVARYGVDQLTLLAAEYRRRHGIAPLHLDDLLEPALVQAVWPQRLPAYGPVLRDGGVLRFRPDPFGYPYTLLDGAPISPGWQAHQGRIRTALMTQRLETLAKKTGRWPETLEAAIVDGLELDNLPRGCRWRLADKSVTIEVDPPSQPAWDPQPAR